MSKQDELTFTVKQSLVVGTATAALTASSACIVNPGPQRPDTAEATDTSEASDTASGDASSDDASSEDTSGDGNS